MEWYEVLAQQTINGLTRGAVFALVALGYTMVYGIIELINFAHGDVFMLGLFISLTYFGLIGMAKTLYGWQLVTILPLVFLATMLTTALINVTIDRLAYRPLRHAGRLSPLITAIGVSLVLSNLFLLLDGQKHLKIPVSWPHIAGREPITYPLLMKSTTVFTLFGVPIHNLDLLIVGVTIVMLLILDRFVYRTQAGKGIRAVAEDPETAALMGVNINGVVVLTFFVGGMMAGSAGLLYGMKYNLQYNMGFVPGIKAFTAAVLGGIGNVRGAMLGGVLLGLTENLSVACIGQQWQPVIAFAVLVGVLMFRPTGLLGEQVGG
jgi:branched-chain amino acid transport system permease protein